MSKQEETERQVVDPTTPVLPDYPYYTGTPTTPDSYPYGDEIGIPPPPPHAQKKPRRSPIILGISLGIALLLLFASAGLFYLARTYVINKAQPTPIVRFVPATATPTAHPTTQATVTPLPTVDPNYAASEILLDMEKAGCPCGYNAGYGTTIWNYTGQNYYVSVHATSSATWEDPPQSTDSEYVGLWVYVDAATAEQAYTEVGNDQGTGLAHYQWPTEYQHGRCLLLIRTAYGNGTTPWSGYDQVVNQYCI